MREAEWRETAPVTATSVSIVSVSGPEETMTEAHLSLEPHYSFEQMPALRNLIAQQLSDAERVQIDTSNLQRAPLMLVQLLFAAQRSAGAGRRQLDILCPAGGALAEAMNSLGFSDASDLRPLLEDGIWCGLHAN